MQRPLGPLPIRPKPWDRLPGSGKPLPTRALGPADARQWRLWEEEVRVADPLDRRFTRQARDIDIEVRGPDPEHKGRRRVKTVWPVHAGSVKNAEARPRKWKRADAVQAVYKLRRWNCEGAIGIREVKRKNGAVFKRPRQYGGFVGAAALRVAETLLLDFGYLTTTGELFPSYDQIAEKAGLGRSTIADALKRLRRLGVISWLRRCLGAVVDGDFKLMQISNLYTVHPASEWRGYAEPRKVAPSPDCWGATPALPDLTDQAARARTMVEAAQIYGDNPADKWCRTMKSACETAAGTPANLSPAAASPLAPVEAPADVPAPPATEEDRANAQALLAAFRAGRSPPS